MKYEKISISKARGHLSQIAKGQTTFVIMKKKQPVSVLMPSNHYANVISLLFTAIADYEKFMEYVAFVEENEGFDLKLEKSYVNMDELGSPEINISITDARANFYKITQSESLKFITRWNKPVLVLLSVYQYDILNLLFVLAIHDPDKFREMLASTNLCEMRSNKCESCSCAEQSQNKED